MRLAIRWKLVLGIGLPLLLIYSASLALVSFKLEERGYVRMTQHVTTLARHYAARLDGTFRTFAQVGRTTAEFLTVHEDLTEAEIWSFLESNVNQDPLIYGSCVAFEPYSYRADQRLFCPYVYRGEGGLKRMDVADAYDYTDPKWDWYRIARERGMPFWTEPFFDEGAGDIIMCTFVAPFFKDGVFRGTVNIDIPLDQLQSHAGAATGGTETFAIISREGKFIVHQDPASIMHETIFSLAEHLNRQDLADYGARMLAGEAGVRRLPDWNDSEALLMYYAPISSTGWSLYATVPEAEALAFERQQMLLGIYGMGAALVVITLALLFAASRITRPIERLASAVHALSSGKLDAAAVDAPSNDEIGDLGRAFNKMVTDLREHVTALTEMTRSTEAVESELRIAHNIQSALLPRTFPPFPELKEFDLHAVNSPARHIGGDFFDFFFVEKDVLMFVIADVSGKGVPAAMFMAVARTIIRNLAPTCPSPGLLLKRLNDMLLKDNTESMFITMFVARYNICSGRLVYANAGHPLPYVVNSRGEVRPFGEVTGTIVGALPDVVFAEATAELDAGDRLVLYTDGVTEARSERGDFFQSIGLERLLATFARESAQQLCVTCVDVVTEFQSGEISDDITMLVLGRNATSTAERQPT